MAEDKAPDTAEDAEGTDSRDAASAEASSEPGKPETVTVADPQGNEFETEVGADGVNPVSPNNPPTKALLTDEDVQTVKDAQAAADERQLTQVTGTNPEGESPSPDAEESDGSAEDAGDESQEPPGKNASRDDWVKYATDVKDASEADLTDAEGKPLTRDELVEKYGS